MSITTLFFYRFVLRIVDIDDKSKLQNFDAETFWKSIGLN